MLPPWKETIDKLFIQFLPFLECAYNQGFGVCQLDPNYDPIVPSVVILFAIIIYSYVWSVIGQNVSKVDQIWSITPGVYSCHFLYLFYAREGARGRHGFHQRLALLTSLIILWGLRLTYNFWRRGGYGNLITHEEDYRWPILRKMMHPMLFQVFNLTFIASYQNILLWLLAYPAYIVMQSKQHRIHGIDIFLAATFLFLLIMETIADQQHYDFHTAKNKMTADERQKSFRKDIRDGFLQSGLFLYSRHPNYFAEQLIWVVVYLFSVSSSMHPINHSIIGAILLVLLFQGSMAFSESITLSKYPAYEDYQLTTSQCVPWPKHGRRVKKHLQ